MEARNLRVDYTKPTLYNVSTAELSYSCSYINRFRYVFLVFLVPDTAQFLTRVEQIAGIGLSKPVLRLQRKIYTK